MQQALAIHSIQCFSTINFHRKYHYFDHLRRNKQYPFPHSTSFSVPKEVKVSASSKQKPPEVESVIGGLIQSSLFIIYLGFFFQDWIDKRFSFFVCFFPDDEDELLLEKVIVVDDVGDLGWLPAFPHVLTASMANFLFGYHIG